MDFKSGEQKARCLARRDGAVQFVTDNSNCLNLPDVTETSIFSTFTTKAAIAAKPRDASAIFVRFHTTTQSLVLSRKL